MTQFKYQKLTKLEENLANKIKQLEDELVTFPAHARRQKANKNFTAFLLLCLVGSLVFYVGVGMAVALSGLAFLTLIAVGYALFVPLILVPAIILVVVPIKKLYLWVQNLFSSEKIKAQNKDYNHFHNNLQRLKKLAAKKMTYRQK